jgi:hypothetical protein
MQGAIVDTPAVGDIAGDERPEIVVGTNEEYGVGAPGEGGLNADNVEARALEQLGSVAGLDVAHGRVYAIKPDGDSDGDLMQGSSPFLDGWPAKIGRLAAELLPIVGEGITGAPVIGPAECGAAGPKVGVIPDAGFGYLLNPDGDSCLGNGADGRDRVLDTAPPAGAVQDSPAFTAVGHPAFGDLAGVSFLAPAAGLRRALDAAVNEYQQGSQDFVGAWSTRDGHFRPGFPAVVNDLQFLTGPSVADIDGDASQEVLAGTASLDLTALDASGRPASASWPKLTSDWMVANPLIGSFGADQRKVVVALTRSGQVLAYRTSAPACSPSSWPRFHHDNANSGDFRRDAVAPGRAGTLVATHDKVSFVAPGDDLMCGRVARFEIATGGSREAALTGDFKPVEAQPVDPGAETSIAPPASGAWLALRALDDQGNVGRPAAVRLAR